MAFALLGATFGHIFWDEMLFMYNRFLSNCNLFEGMKIAPGMYTPDLLGQP